MSYLLCIETANPQHLHQQKALAEYYCASVSAADADTGRKIRAVSRASGITQRYSVINDFAPGSEGYRFFPEAGSLEPLPTLNARMNLFRTEAFSLSLKAVKKIKGFEKIRHRISHIITVTCTGLFAPGLDIELVNALNLRSGISRSSINFMGCNAAVLAARQAHDICTADKNAVVLIVCTELCTLHYQNNHSEDYIMSNMLFGDGSAAALISGENISPDQSYRPLRICSFQSLIVKEGIKDMAWQVSEQGFIMNLSSYVSSLLNSNMRSMLGANGIVPADVTHWAIHPGGKKILDEFCTTMDLDKKKLSFSYQVLSDFGNMSSATILFVLKAMLAAENMKANEKIFAAAFGPGLTIESSLLEHV